MRRCGGGGSATAVEIIKRTFNKIKRDRIVSEQRN
jgi:hypothetical protein